MASAAIKLFRDPSLVERVAQELRTRGYSEEVAIVASAGGDAQALAKALGLTLGQTTIPGVGAVVVSGPMAAALDQAGGDGVAAALAHAWGISEAAMGYYQVGLASGGVVLSVHTDEARLQAAKAVLRAAEEATAAPERGPGFVQADRMTETNPLDARMSGDFRQY